MSASQQIDGVGAGAGAGTSASAVAAPARAPRVVDAAAIAAAEHLIEVNVQQSLDSLDAWKVTVGFRGGKAGTCSTSERKCTWEPGSTDANLCPGCALYRAIVLERRSFSVGGRSDVCDYLVSAIAEPLIFEFVKNGAWLTPMRDFGEGAWFVRHPLTVARREPSAMAPTVSVALQRNRVRIFDAHALLTSLGFDDNDARAEILDHLRDYWRTEAGGRIYSLDEFLDALRPLSDISRTIARLGLNAHDIKLDRVIAGISAIPLMAAPGSK